MYQHINLKNDKYAFIVKVLDEDIVGHISIIKKNLEIPLLEKNK
ncbi:MAG: hypothetical protein ACLFPS_04515 [Clostridia bacterium]